MVNRHNGALAACHRQPLFVPRENANDQIVQTRDHIGELKGKRSCIKDRRSREVELLYAMTRRR
jgi:hypothetical protein